MADYPLPPPISDFDRRNGPPSNIMMTAAAVFGGLLSSAEGLAEHEASDMLKGVDAVADWALFLAERLHLAADRRYPNG